MDPGRPAPTNSVLLQYYSKQELKRNEKSLTNTNTENDMNSSSNYMVKESRGMLHIGIGKIKNGKDTINTSSQINELSN